MDTIKSSVGRKGINTRKDVMVIQSLLNHCIHLLIPLKTLDVDGIIGPRTIHYIENFQQSVVNLSSPDGRVDPNGKTLRTLNTNARYRERTQNTANFESLTQHYFSAKPRSSYQFPLDTRPSPSYKEGMRKFGSQRSQGRLHAGSDLYARVGAPVYAMEEGVVENPGYAFYLGTYAIEIKHPSFLARYGELGKIAPNLKAKSTVKKGQIIGYVGELRGLNMSMLHLELYSGLAQGPLTDRKNLPYKRRTDLIDPTPILDSAL